MKVKERWRMAPRMPYIALESSIRREGRPCPTTAQGSQIEG